MEYTPGFIEAKWKQKWKEADIYKVEIDRSKPKYYILDMFPYPSGAGLHVGHPLGYIATDIFSRFKRHQGYNVLHPMGFDAFGLPAEQYAIQTGVMPQISTEQNIKRYREQLDNLSFSYDWSRSVTTSDPAYYRWTQWIFIRLYEHYFNTKENKAKPVSELIEVFEKSGSEQAAAFSTIEDHFTAQQWKAFSPKQKDDVLMHYRLAYKGQAFVNWCEELGTVLANDEVKDGLSERGGYPVVQRPMEQWFLRITAYADRLLNDLKTLEWTDALKSMQENWIGKSEGAQVFFKIKDSEESIEIFTTRPDTIFGASFIVLAPEHDLVEKLVTPEQQHTVKNYLDYAKTRSERERISETKQVTGAFTGAYAVHPFTGESIPVWISDYVLKDYGAGAIMAVPAGDLRDHAFAEKFSLPIIEIIDRSAHPKATIEDKLGTMINSGFLNGLEVKDAIKMAIGEIATKGIGKAKVNFRLRDANFSRQRYWGEPFPVCYDEDGICHPLSDTDLPLMLPELEDFRPGAGSQSPLARVPAWQSTREGYRRETDTMPGFAGSSWYFLRYMDACNPDELVSHEAIDYWQNVDLYVGGTEHAVGHLMYARFWHKFLFDLGIVNTQEPFRKLINQGMIQGRSNFVFRAKENFFEEYLKINVLDKYFADSGVYRLTEDEYDEEFCADWAFKSNDLVIEVVSWKLEDKIERIKGAVLKAGKRLLIITNEELTMSINHPLVIAEKIRTAIDGSENFIFDKSEEIDSQLYVSYNLTGNYSADCFSKIHVDVNIVHNDYLDIDAAVATRQFENAYFLIDDNKQFSCSWEVEKMSKSKYNVVNPDDMVAAYGADCFRMYEMFLGPIDQAKPWDTKGIDGVAKFLRRLWNLFFDENGKIQLSDTEPTREELKILHQCIKKVSEEVERFSFNTCVSAFMICVNDLRRIECRNLSVLKDLLKLVSPFAPHIAEELWEQSGEAFSVTLQPYPVFDEKYLKEDHIEYPVCINGKKRALLLLPADMDKADAEKQAVSLPEITKWLDGTPVKKVIVVSGKMINIVI